MGLCLQLHKSLSATEKIIQQRKKRYLKNGAEIYHGGSGFFCSYARIVSYQHKIKICL